MTNLTKTIIFFELTDYSLLRFPRWISNEMLDSSPNLHLIYIYLYKYKQKDFSLQDLPLNATIIFLDSNIRKIDLVLNKFKNNSTLFTFAIRPPEFYVINRAKKLGIESKIVQHGIFIPFMKRELSYYIDGFKKMYIYFKCIYALSKITDACFLDLVKEVYKVFVLGRKSIAESGFIGCNILPNQAFVYSEYWKEYFIDNYGFGANQFILTGSPDLKFYSSVINEDKQEAVCYICQTLVEDGRLAKNVFLDYLNILSRTLGKSKQIYIKLHPRSDLSLYKELIKRNETIIINDSLPNCTKYIGHYSTLLMLPLYITGSVFLWKFHGHPIPEYFSKSTMYCGNTEIELVEFLATKNNSLPNKKSLNYYFNKPNLNPYSAICESVEY